MDSNTSSLMSCAKYQEYQFALKSLTNLIPALTGGINVNKRMRISLSPKMEASVVDYIDIQRENYIFTKKVWQSGKASIRLDAYKTSSNM